MKALLHTCIVSDIMSSVFNTHLPSKPYKVMNFQP
jgi:hypothetical protein